MENLNQVPQTQAAASTDPALVLNARLEFWLDTCRQALQRRTVAQRVVELYERHGSRFETPSLQQVQDVLGALDAALPVWEQEHPELFFQTLELNFPELVRLD